MKWNVDHIIFFCQWIGVQIKYRFFLFLAYNLLCLFILISWNSSWLSVTDRNSIFIRSHLKYSQPRIYPCPHYYGNKYSDCAFAVFSFFFCFSSTRILCRCYPTPGWLASKASGIFYSPRQLFCRRRKESVS